MCNLCAHCNSISEVDMCVQCKLYIKPSSGLILVVIRDNLVRCECLQY